MSEDTDEIRCYWRTVSREYTILRMLLGLRIATADTHMDATADVHKLLHAELHRCADAYNREGDQNCGACGHRELPDEYPAPFGTSPWGFCPVANKTQHKDNSGCRRWTAREEAPADEC